VVLSRVLGGRVGMFEPKIEKVNTGYGKDFVMRSFIVCSYRHWSK
jgi:hypothetical protein